VNSPGRAWLTVISPVGQVLQAFPESIQTICGELVVENLCNAKVGRVVEIEFPEYRIFKRAKETPA